MYFVVRRWIFMGLALCALGLFINSVRLALPPSTVVIETEPVGGSYYENAVRYAAKLQAAGLKTEIKPNPQSLDTIDRIEAGNPRIDIGFTVQPLDRVAYPNVVSAGVIEVQPLFIFYNRSLGALQTPRSLLGKRLVMPPKNSASAEAARAVLSLYGVSEVNATFTYLPIAAATEQLKKR